MIQTICIFIIGLAYPAICESGSHVYPVGICQNVDDYTIYCTAQIDDFPARLQPYVPEFGGINCYEDTCDYLGGGSLVSENYQYALACPQGMFQYYITFELTMSHTWQCLDHGGEIKLKFAELYNGNGFAYYWYLPFDVLWQDPASNPYPVWMWMLSSWEWSMEQQ